MKYLVVLIASLAFVNICWCADLDPSSAREIVEEPPAIDLLHSAVDMNALDASMNTVASIRQTMKSAIQSRRTENDILKPWTQTISGLKESWAVCLIPFARFTATLYDAEKTYLGGEEVQKQIDNMKQDGTNTLRFTVQLCSKGKGSWLWPYKAGPGNKELLESVRFVLGIDDRHSLQVAHKPSIEMREHSSKFWAGLVAGGTRTKIDYYATFTVDFPLRNPKGESLIGPETKMLILRIIGPKDEWTVPFKLEKLPSRP